MDLTSFYYNIRQRFPVIHEQGAEFEKYLLKVLKRISYTGIENFPNRSYGIYFMGYIEGMLGERKKKFQWGQVQLLSQIADIYLEERAKILKLK